MTRFDVATAELRRSECLQQEIWQKVVVATTEVHNPAVMTLVLTTLNEMIDITTARQAALRTHLPRIVFVMFHEQNQPYELIAQALGRPVGTIKTWLHRARLEVLERLRRRGMVEEEQPDEGDREVRKR